MEGVWAVKFKRKILLDIVGAVDIIKLNGINQTYPPQNNNITEYSSIKFNDAKLLRQDLE